MEVKPWTCCGKYFYPLVVPFFVNYVVQNAIVQNTDDFIDLSSGVYYVWAAHLTCFGKAITPSEKISVSELSEFSVESEYARMLCIFTICISFMLFSPIIIVCGVLYLIVKYIADRVRIKRVYDHRVQLNYGIERSKTDLKSHLRMIRLVMRLTLFSLSIFTFIASCFFVVRVLTNDGFLPHALLSSTLHFVCLAVMFVVWRLDVAHNDVRLLASQVEIHEKHSYPLNAYQPPFKFLLQ
ncbi:5 TM domain-containing transmembrane protein [Acrasis kona]|uniref:5 TM domain-containing transmembrane protein n=1 Tax=Acrasis kona TaxID=1008807 RepID=A0AAW2ZC16_9EUKA